MQITISRKDKIVMLREEKSRETCSRIERRRKDNKKKQKKSARNYTSITK